jgi:5-methylcytosine-specific restriction protein A
MPVRANKACSVPGCKMYAYYRGKCKVHTRQQDKDRGTSHARGYGVTWAKVRSQILNAEPLCRRCVADGKTVVADIVHHIDRDSSNNDPSNLEPICRTHHADEHKGEYQ